MMALDAESVMMFGVSHSGPSMSQKGPSKSRRRA
jgi:hypothetical protein